MDIRETHPSLKEFDLLDSVVIDSVGGVVRKSGTNYKLFTEDQIQKHTVDKVVLKTVLKGFAHENSDFKEGYNEALRNVAELVGLESQTSCEEEE